MCTYIILLPPLPKKLSSNRSTSRMDDDKKSESVLDATLYDTILTESLLVNTKEDETVTCRAARVLNNKYTSPYGLLAFYDESIFVDGMSLRGTNEIGVNNRADRFLVTRLGKQASESVCAKVSLNSYNMCNGVNIYTLSKTNKHMFRVYPYNRVIISSGLETETYPIRNVTVSEPPGVEPCPNTRLDSTTEPVAIPYVFDINPELTDYEQAIMIKYYAIHYRVTITRQLYHTIFTYFQDGRSWFVVHDGRATAQIRGSVFVGGREASVNIPAFPYDPQPLMLDDEI